MTIRNLEALIQPNSVGVVGVSSSPDTIGRKIVANLLGGAFKGDIHAVGHSRIEAGRAIWSPSVAEMRSVPDLAVITTPASAVPGIIADLGARGTRAAIVIASGFIGNPLLEQRALDAARPHLLRILGPNCLGMQRPAAGLNASFAHIAAAKGGLALLSQSGALVTALLDWAAAHGIGLSAAVSVGDMLDIDLGDLIDLYAADHETRAILMYVEGVTNPAKFMSAARAASRRKPVIAIKAGRTTATGRAALSHTGALIGDHDACRAAFDRAGIVMVETLTELFDAAELLSTTRPTAGPRLAIVTNGGGAGILAADAMANGEARLASLSKATMAALDACLPPTWSHGNPVDIGGGATASRYVQAIEAVAADPGVDAMLIMECPTAVTSGAAIADAVKASVLRQPSGHSPAVLACWLGGPNTATARAILAPAGIPVFDTPEAAIKGFGFLLAARRARQALMAAPATFPGREIARETAEALLAAARAEGRTWLNEVETKTLLQCYGIPTVPTRLASDAQGVAQACAALGPPYVVKIISPDIIHKSDVGGVALHLADADAATAAARAMLAKLARSHPDAKISGFAVQTMVQRPDAIELLAGIADDATFGPLVVIGAGGKAVEVMRDRALGLPPLDASLARGLVSRTRVARLLAGYRDVPPSSMEAITATLEALSAMAIDLPGLLELDINPLLADAAGVLALDGRVRIAGQPGGASRLVIRPVPMEWAANLVTRKGLAFHVRPVRPDDEAALVDLFAHIDRDDLRFRFLSAISHVDPDRIAAMTQIDYARTMHFLAFEGGVLIASAMLAADPDGLRAEVAISVRKDRRNHGVSWTLLDHVLRYARAQGIKTVESIENADNAAAIDLQRDMGFTARRLKNDPAEVVVTKAL